jgi:hypothetical protein
MRQDTIGSMPRRLVLRCLVLAVGLLVSPLSTGLQAGDLVILGDPRPDGAETSDLGRRFGTALCASGPPRTVLDALGPDAERILIHRFDAGRWQDLEAARTYIARVLTAVPEGGRLSPGVYWAEARPPEILASVELSNGRRQAFHLANGYAHVQDSAGCEWWARYLGPDRAKWVVWP